MACADLFIIIGSRRPDSGNFLNRSNITEDKNCRNSRSLHLRSQVEVPIALKYACLSCRPSKTRESCLSLRRHCGEDLILAPCTHIFEYTPFPASPPISVVAFRVIHRGWASLGLFQIFNLVRSQLRISQSCLIWHELRASSRLTRTSWRLRY